MSHRVFLGLGSNLGDRRASLQQAIGLTEKLVGPIVGQSAFYVSQPWGFTSPNYFVNAVVCCRTQLSPRAVLRATQHIERSMGRRQKSTDGHYHDRIIDIDLLLFDRLTIAASDLRIPHPLMLQRDFVMRPLVEVMMQLSLGPDRFQML